MMQIVIDIDEKDYDDIVTDNPRNLNVYERMIKDGIVVKEGIDFTDDGLVVCDPNLYEEWEEY